MALANLCDRILQVFYRSIMSASKEFTLQEVTGHNTKKDLYMVIHDKVYDCSSFVDEHPCVSSSRLYSFPPFSRE